MSLFSLKKDGFGRDIKKAADRGFAALVLDGVDVAEGLQQEDSADILRQAIGIARKFHEPVWLEAAARRLVQIDSGPDSVVELVSVLAAKNKIAEAIEVRESVAADLRSSDAWRATEGVLLAKQGRIEDALAVFDQLEGHRPGVYPAPVVFPTATEMLSQCELETVLPFVSELARRFPSHPLAQALNIRAVLFSGDFDEARRLALAPEFNLDDVPRFDRRAFVEAVVAVISLTGSKVDVFDYVTERIAADKTHWALYTTASDVAKAIWRKKDYDRILAEIPAEVWESAGALAVRARWCIDEHRSDEAEAHISALREKSASLFLNVQFYRMVHMHRPEDVEAAFAACINAGIPRAGPVIGYCMYRYYMGTEQEEYASLLHQLDEFGEASRLDALHWQTRFRCQVAAGMDEAARQEFQALPAGLRKSERLWPFEMYFQASDGRHAEARSGWTRFIREARHFCVNSRSSYPTTATLKYRPRPGAVLLFVNVFNNMTYIDWFLDHYRSLGVDHFFITDNNSTDGIGERLAGEPDVSLFTNRDSFAGSSFGVIWTNHMMQRFGVGHWCFHVDIDEGFIFPGQSDGRTLADLLAYMDEHGYETLTALELDMYPERLQQTDHANLFQANCYFDTDYFTTRSEIPPYVIYQGGIRQRMTGLALSMHKTPLVKVSPDVRYIECNHDATHLPLADVTAAVLHYKFVGDMKARIDEAVDRGEHFAGAVSYRRLNEAADRHGWSESLLSEFSRQYEGPHSVEEAGLMAGSAAWEAHTGKNAPVGA